MVEIVVNYIGWEDRNQKVKEQEAKGLRMLHDDFDPDWQPGDEPHGTITFTDVMPPPPPPPIDWQAEWGKATTAAGKVAVLAKMLGLRVS
jgi:hypothetical protein